MTPIGHASISYIAGSWYKPYLIFFVAGGVLPDVDFIFLPFSFFNEIHRVVTHNVFFVLFSAIIIALLFKNKYSIHIIFLIVILTGLLHLFIDSIIDSNPTNGIGVALFYPVSGEFFSPFNLVSKNYVHADGWDNMQQMIRVNMKYIIFEIPFLIFAVFIFISRKRHYNIPDYRDGL